jgi:hypothetical protein
VRFNNIKAAIQKSPLFRLLILMSIIIAFLAGIISNITTIEGFFQKNLILSLIILIIGILVLLFIIISSDFFQKQALSKALGELTPGVNINIYQDKFGEPMFININAEKKTKEYVFIHSYFYLDAVTDIDDTVQYFAITIRNRTFKPIFKSPGYPVNHPSFQIQLGVSTFSTISNRPEYIIGWVGAHDFSYYETHYLGNPGHYQNFGFGLNESGYLPKELRDYISVITGNPQYHSGKSIQAEEEFSTLRDFRSKMIFNTYAVSIPFKKIKDLAGSSLGVSYYQVRTLNHTI